MLGKSRIRCAACTACFVLGAAAGGYAQQQTATAPAKPAAPGREVYDQLLATYLDQARAMAVRTEPGASWAWMNGLTLDTRARSVNDLVTIQVVESISAAGSADAALSKESDGSASLLSLFGLEKKLPDFIDPTSLAGVRSNTDFQGGGTTTRAGQLTASLTARVAEVLPNGDLLVEGVREIEINGDRQILVLTGVVRPVDIGPANIVPSTLIGQMRIRYFGQGLMRDNLRPGFIIRLLNRIF
ncbi:MAG: flagellar basal body L-ring protein FlgH [Acidobacteria bacterium]|nr:flagellar basal body L-ring protein FlgH [Acidobacteriota bacterium]